MMHEEIKAQEPRVQVTISANEAIRVLAEIFVLNIAYRTACFSGNALLCHPPCISVIIFTDLSVIISASDHHMHFPGGISKWFPFRECFSILVSDQAFTILQSSYLPKKGSTNRKFSYISLFTPYLLLINIVLILGA